MNRRRKSLLVVLLILVLAPIGLGGLGTVELGIWLLLLGAWILALVFWAKNADTDAARVGPPA